MSKLWHLKEIVNLVTKKPQPQQVDPNQLLLPNQIGCRIIEIQTEIYESQTLTKQTILELLDQYNKAIEFYSQRGSKKYVIYQKKIQNFLSKPSVAEVLKGKTGTLIIKKQKNQEQIKKLQLHSHAQVRRIMETSESSGKKQQDIIRNHLQSQQKDLQERLKRKRAMSTQNKRQKITTASFTMPISQQQLPTNPDVYVSVFQAKLPQSQNYIHINRMKNKFQKIAF